MKPLTDIKYVELEQAGVAEVPASFSFRHFIEATFRPLASELPHRHNYHELFIVESGHGHHAIDAQSIALVPNTVSLINRGQVHVVEHLTNFTGWLIRFTDDFLPADLVSQAWNYRATLLSQFGQNHTLTVEPHELRDLAGVLELIEAEWTKRETFQKEQVLRHMLAVLLIRLERISQTSRTATQGEREAYRMYQQFITLLEDHFARHHDVQHYATALQLSPTRLSRTLVRFVGKSTKQLIDERIVLEAKRYLLYTDLSIKEIAFALGYNDLFHLSKTFRRLMGSAPQAFREQHQKMT